MADLPGTAPSALQLAEARKRLIARKPQLPADHGLFSDERDQLDLVDLTRKQP